jgi:hypothetical protein
MPEKPQVHERTIGKHLDRMLYSLKLSRILPADRNRPDVIEGCHKYANWFFEDSEYSSSCLHRQMWFQYLDSQKSRTGLCWRACLSPVCGQKGGNLTICLAVSQKMAFYVYLDVYKLWSCKGTVPVWQTDRVRKCCNNVLVKSLNCQKYLLLNSTIGQMYMSNSIGSKMYNYICCCKVWFV